MSTAIKKTPFAMELFESKDTSRDSVAAEESKKNLMETESTPVGIYLLDFLDFVQEAIVAFDLVGSGFRLALLGNPGQVPLLALHLEHVPRTIFPFEYTTLQVPDEQSTADIVRDVDFPDLYSKCDVMQSQLLALDPMYMAHFSTNLPKAKMLQVVWGPRQDLYNKCPVVAFLTAYGICRIVSKRAVSRKWDVLICDLNKIFRQTIFPTEPFKGKVESFEILQNAVNLHWITAIDWHSNNALFYVANAAGWIVGLQFCDELTEATEYFRYQRTSGQIRYLKAFDDFLLVGYLAGTVELYKLNHATRKEPATMKIVGSLWTRVDRITCTKAEITQLKNSNFYIVVFIKSSHVIVCSLRNDGSLANRMTFFVGGTVITGIEVYSANEFVVAAITGRMKLLHVHVDASSGELRVTERQIETDLPVKNYQIMAMSTMPNKSLWSFLLYRNKQANRSSQYSYFSAFLALCRISVIEVLDHLWSPKLSSISPYLDHLTVMRTEIMTGKRRTYYKPLCAIQNLVVPSTVDHLLLLQLQLRLTMVMALDVFQKGNCTFIIRSTPHQIETFVRLTKATYIICRLQRMRRKMLKGMPSYFQNLSITCLRRKFNILLTALNSTDNDLEGLTEVIKNFVLLLSNAFEEVSFPYKEVKDMCKGCNAVINPDTMQCNNKDEMPRCCITYTQVDGLTFKLNQRCPLCGQYVSANKVLLTEVLDKDESPTCTLCRLDFITDEI